MVDLQRQARRRGSAPNRDLDGNVQSDRDQHASLRPRRRWRRQRRRLNDEMV